MSLSVSVMGWEDKTRKINSLRMLEVMPLTRAGCSRCGRDSTREFSVHLKHFWCCVIRKGGATSVSLYARRYRREVCRTRKFSPRNLFARWIPTVYRNVSRCNIFARKRNLTGEPCRNGDEEEKSCTLHMQLLIYRAVTDSSRFRLCVGVCVPCFPIETRFSVPLFYVYV